MSGPYCARCSGGDTIYMRGFDPLCAACSEAVEDAVLRDYWLDHGDDLSFDEFVLRLCDNVPRSATASTV